MSVGSAAPDIIDALFSTAETLHANDDVTTTDGRGVSDAVGDYLMIGVQDPDSIDLETVATSIFDWETVGLEADIQESCDIDFCAVSWNGDIDMGAARRRAYAIAIEFCQAVRGRGEDIGLDASMWLRPGSLELRGAQAVTGARAVVHGQIHVESLV